MLCLEQECNWSARDEVEATAKHWANFHQSTHPGHRVSITWATWDDKTLEIDAGARGRIRKSKAQRAPESATVPAAEQGTVLIIESSPYLTGRIVQVLRRAGYATLQAPTAIEGLQLATEAQPDLILLAVGMPDLDGTKVSRLLREDPLTSAIPIIAMSVGDIEDEQAQDGKPMWIGRL